MMVRTKPGELPPPDSRTLRRLEILEAQLRRDADAVAELAAGFRLAISREHDAHRGPEPRPEVRQAGVCDRWLPRTTGRCGRRPLHRGSCRTTAQLESEAAARRAKRRAVA